MKFEFSPQIFKHYSNVKFYEKYVQWEQSCSMRTDRHYEANSSFLQFCGHTQNVAAQIMQGVRRCTRFITDMMFSWW